MTDIILSISVQELCQYEGCNEQLIVEVVDHGIAHPVKGRSVADWVFDTTSVRWLQKAIRLHYDLEIDWIAVAMVIDLLRENESLQKQNQCIEQQLKRFIDPSLA
jgi:chaperone modulatory protein CbpM